MRNLLLSSYSMYELTFYERSTVHLYIYCPWPICDGCNQCGVWLCWSRVRLWSGCRRSFSIEQFPPRRLDSDQHQSSSRLHTSQHTEPVPMASPPWGKNAKKLRACPNRNEDLVHCRTRQQYKVEN